jgi:hypothetical protein
MYITPAKKLCRNAFASWVFFAIEVLLLRDIRLNQLFIRYNVN